MTDNGMSQTTETLGSVPDLGSSFPKRPRFMGRRATVHVVLVAALAQGWPNVTYPFGMEASIDIHELARIWCC